MTHAFIDVLYTYHSSSLESLVDHLSGLSERSQKSRRESLSLTPWDEERIVTGSASFGRLLQESLAEKRGLASNIAFLTLREWLSPIDPPFWQEEALSWTLGTFLLELSHDHKKPYARALAHAMAPSPKEGDALLLAPEEAPESPKASSPPQTLQAHHLNFASILAKTYRELMLYAPERLETWESKPPQDNDWPALIWHEFRKNPKELPPHLGEELLDRNEKPSENLEKCFQNLPLTLFHLDPLPLPLLRATEHWAKHFDIHVYTLDFPSEKNLPPLLRAFALKEEGESLSPEGRTKGGSKKAQDRGEDKDFHSESLMPKAPLISRPSDSSLSRLQSFLSHPQVPEPGLFRPDESLSFHLAMDPLQEVELLREKLLQLFSSDPELEPKDVHILVPDFTRYAPYLEAVFSEELLVRSQGSDHPLSLSFPPKRSIMEGQNPVQEAFMTLLESFDDPLFPPNLSTLYNWMRRPPLLQKLELKEDEVLKIFRLFGKEGLREAKTNSLTPQANSFEEGFQRFLLGYALPNSGLELYHGLPPYDDMEGQDIEALGQVMGLIQEILAFHARLNQPLTRKNWAQKLLSLLELHLPPPSSPHSANAYLALPLRRLFLSWSKDENEAPLLDFHALLALLRASVQRGTSTSLLFAGGIKASAFLPHRVFPAKLLAFLGMDTLAFQGQRLPPHLEALPSTLRPPRLSDLRLKGLQEALLSAGSYFLVFSSSGRDHLPAPLLGLLHYLEEKSPPEGRSQWLKHYPQSPFSEDNFLPTAPFAHGIETLAFISKHTKKPTAYKGSKVYHPSLETPALSKHLDLKELLNFFQDPAKHYAEKQADLKLLPEDEPMKTGLPLALGPLESWALGMRILAWELEGIPKEVYEDVLVKEGQVPIGAGQKASLWQAQKSVQAILAPIPEAQRKGGQKCFLSTNLGDFELEGLLDDHQPSFHCRQVLSMSSLKIEAVWKLWIEHLFLNAASQKGQSTALYTKNGSLSFPPMSMTESREALRLLLGIYELGQSRPLPFFIRTSWAYLKHKRRAPRASYVPKDVEECWYKAKLYYEGQSDQSLPYVSLYFPPPPHYSPFQDPLFQALTEAALSPFYKTLSPLHRSL